MPVFSRNHQEERLPNFSSSAQAPPVASSLSPASAIFSFLAIHSTSCQSISSSSFAARIPFYESPKQSNPTPPQKKRYLGDALSKSGKLTSINPSQFCANSIPFNTSQAPHPSTPQERETWIRRIAHLVKGPVNAFVELSSLFLPCTMGGGEHAFGELASSGDFV
jgi:hypothetical protein